jgi:hypothetical protein
MIIGGCEVKEKGERQVRIYKNLNVVHQNIRSLWGNCGELEILLETEINNVEVLRFTEHWLNCHKIHAHFWGTWRCASFLGHSYLEEFL